jgi:hypothetical protein
MDHPRPGLRYVDARDLDGSKIRFSGLEVEGTDRQKLGTVEGFILDRNSARPYYVVVNAGGWFRSKHVLVPIGYIMFDAGDKKLRADLTRERVSKFPGFDKGEFAKLSEDELKRMDDEVWNAYNPDATVIVRYEHAHYRYPTWWEVDFYDPQREPVGPRAVK